MTLRARLTLASAVAVAAAVALASVAVWFIVRDQLRERVDETLRGRAAEVELREGPAGDVSVELPRAPLGAASGYVQLVPTSGEVALLPGERRQLPVTQSTRDVATGEADEFFEDATVRGIHVRVLTTQVAPGLAAQVALPLADVDRVLERLALILGLVAVAGIGAAAGLGLIVSRAALRPVRALTETAEHVATTHDLSRRIAASGEDELSRLATSFNTMLTALEASLATQRQLVADASHELRTPLTSLRTNVEVLARAEQLSPDERGRLHAEVLAQIEELSTLVADIVDLARGTEPAALVEDVHLDEIVADAVERARRHAPSVSFRTDLEPTLVRGVPARLDRAVANLLDNAAKWSPEGGTVSVVLRGGELSVEDEGPGIAESDLPFVFDRFYRASSARSRSGSGLGLAIVRQVAESHRGSVAAGRAASGGALLRLRLPAAAENGSAGAISNS